mmetsp:Transcript_80457/g.236658  ORF Transcript_80457/g.236658 Transcript_80457/m.236658 type:complete len:320 (-) Transcript_80457:401-1360(-)
MCARREGNTAGKVTTSSYSLNMMSVKLGIWAQLENFLANKYCDFRKTLRPTSPICSIKKGCRMPFPMVNLVLLSFRSSRVTSVVTLYVCMSPTPTSVCSSDVVTFSSEWVMCGSSRLIGRTLCGQSTYVMHLRALNISIGVAASCSLRSSTGPKARAYMASSSVAVNHAPFLNLHRGTLREWLAHRPCFKVTVQFWRLVTGVQSSASALASRRLRESHWWCFGSARGAPSMVALAHWLVAAMQMSDDVLEVWSQWMYEKGLTGSVASLSRMNFSGTPAAARLLVSASASLIMCAKGLTRSAPRAEYTLGTSLTPSSFIM